MSVPLHGGCKGYVTERAFIFTWMSSSPVAETPVPSWNSRLTAVGGTPIPWGATREPWFFLDTDRLAHDRATGRDPERVVGRERLQLAFLNPNLEGLLVRLHSGRETQFAAADDAERLLQRLWPEYRKPMPARALEQGFNLVDLERAAVYDTHLRDALALLGLLPRA